MCMCFFYYRYFVVFFIHFIHANVKTKCSASQPSSKRANEPGSDSSHMSFSNEIHLIIEHINLRYYSEVCVSVCSSRTKCNTHISAENESELDTALTHTLAHTIPPNRIKSYTKHRSTPTENNEKKKREKDFGGAKEK